MTMKPNPMVILTGPTAVGKTALSIALAKKINGAIISADSMQVLNHTINNLLTESQKLLAASSDLEKDMQSFIL